MLQDAMLKLMQPAPILPSDHPLLCYQYSESDKWTSSETDIFHKALLKYDKDFRSIAQEVRNRKERSGLELTWRFQIGTKTIKQCIQFYYVWKKVCIDEYRKLKYLRERRHSHSKGTDSELEEKLYPDAKLLGVKQRF